MDLESCTVESAEGSLGGLICCTLCGTVVAGGMENTAHARSMDIGEVCTHARSKHYKVIGIRAFVVSKLGVAET